MAERTASAELSWASFESRLRAYVRRRVEPGSVDDVVGDILLRLVQHRAALEAARDPTAWMLKVAANAVADHHRRRDVERRALSRAEAEAKLEVAGRHAGGAAAGRAAEEIAHCLRPLIEGLPARYREALILTEVQGLAQAEAALRLGLSRSGLKSRVQRGRVKLKQALLRCCAIRRDGRGGVLDYRQRDGTRTPAGCRPC